MARLIYSGKVPRADDKELNLQELAGRLGAHWETVHG
jgi:hypothetical protein